MISAWESYLFHFIISWVGRHKSQIYYVGPMQQKNIQVYCFFTPEEMNDLSILGGGGGHEIIFDTSDGAMRFFWRQYNGSREKTGILEERLRPGLTCTL